MEFRSCARGVSGVASFITTDEQLQFNRGCCFLIQAVFPEGLPLFSLIYFTIEVCYKRFTTLTYTVREFIYKFTGDGSEKVIKRLSNRGLFKIHLSIHRYEEMWEEDILWIFFDGKPSVFNTFIKV